MIIPLGVDPDGPYRPHLVKVLIGLNVLFWIFQITDNYGLAPLFLDTVEPQYYQWVTHFFLHDDEGVSHLLGNMIFLWAFGTALNSRMGHFRFLLFYLLAGLASAAFHALFTSGLGIPLIEPLNPAFHSGSTKYIMEQAIATGSFNPLSVGASGAIMGLVGLTLILFPKKELPVFYFIFFLGFVRIGKGRARAFWICLMYLLMDVFYLSIAGTDSGIAYTAHIGGFLFGVIYALIGKQLGIVGSHQDDLDQIYLQEKKSIETLFARKKKLDENRRRKAYLETKSKLEKR